MMQLSRSAPAMPAPELKVVSQPRLKVLLIGAEPVDYTIAFANGVAQHARTTLVVPAARFETLQHWFDPALDLRLVDWPRHRSLKNPRFLLRLLRLVRQEKPDVVHLLSNTSLWLNLAMPFLRRVPLITTIHDVTRHPGDRETAALPGWAPRLMVRQSPDVVVHGPGLARQARAEFGKRIGRVHVLQHPAILRYAELAAQQGIRRPETARGFTVLMFGRLFAYKGLGLLLQAEALLGARIPDLRIVIAGRGDDPAAQRALMGDPARYDLRRRFIPDQEVAELFTAADLVVLPYTEASQSGVLALAGAFGCPVVATDVGELRGTIEGAAMGLIVPQGDPAALAEALVTLAADPGRRRQMGVAARRWAQGGVAPASVGAEAVVLYNRVLRRGVGTRPK